MDLIFTTTEWISSKKIYPALRLFLNSIFCISIATYLYSQCYPEQTTVLKAAQLNILSWFVDGNFFLPVVMVLFIWLVSWFIGMLVWYTFSWLIPRAITKEIYAFEVGRQDVVSGLATIRKAARKYASYHLTQAEMTQFYAEIKNVLNEEELNELRNIFKKQEGEVQANFYVLLRLAIAMTIYCLWLPYFSTWLYVTMLVIVVFLMLSMLLSGLVITILPDFAKKIDQIAQQFLANQLPKRTLN